MIKKDGIFKLGYEMRKIWRCNIHCVTNVGERKSKFKKKFILKSIEKQKVCKSNAEEVSFEW